MTQITLFFSDGTKVGLEALPDTPENRKRVTEGEIIVLQDKRGVITIPNSKSNPIVGFRYSVA